MTTIIWILAYTGLFAIALGTANVLFRWSEASHKRKLDTETHRSAVLDSLKRIEATLKHQSKTNSNP